MDLKLYPNNQIANLATLQSFSQKLSQLVGAKKELEAYELTSYGEVRSKLEHFKHKVLGYGVVERAFGEAKQYFEGIKKACSEELKYMEAEFERLKEKQQNLHPDKWVGKIRAACRPKGSKARGRLVPEAEAACAAGGAKPARALVVGKLAIHGAQRDCLEGIKEAAQKICESQHADVLAAKRSLIRHYVAVLKGDGFSCPRAKTLHDLLGHQFQFYTIEDSSLIDKMFACVIKKGISYTQCLDGLAKLVEGIDRLERKDENRVTWDSLKEGNEKPVL